MTPLQRQAYIRSLFGRSIARMGAEALDALLMGVLSVLIEGETDAEAGRWTQAVLAVRAEYLSPSAPPVHDEAAEPTP